MLQVGLILLKILKIIGIILLALICLILLLVLFVLAAPIQYEVRGAFDDKWECKFKASARIYLLLHLIKISFGFKAMKWKLTVKVLFFQIMKKCGQIGKGGSEEAGAGTGGSSQDSGTSETSGQAEDYVSPEEEDAEAAEAAENSDGSDADAEAVPADMDADADADANADHTGEGGYFGLADETGTADSAGADDFADIADYAGVADTADAADSAGADETADADDTAGGSDEPHEDVPSDDGPGLVIPDSSDTWYTDPEPDDAGSVVSEEAAGPSDEAGESSDEADKPSDEAAGPSDETDQDEITDEQLDQMLDELEMDSDSDEESEDSEESILDKAAKVYAFIQRDPVRKLIGKLEKGLMKILRHLIPDSLDVDAEIGQENPYKDGQIAQYAVILHTLYPNHIDLRANFDEKVMKGKFSLRGKIIPGYIVVKLIGMAIVVLLNKDCRALIKKILKGDD